MKKLLLSALAVSSIFFASCSDSDNDIDGGGEDNVNVVVSGIITEDTHWTADNIYELSKKVYVAADVTLTIDPGTIIKGQSGTEENSSALVIGRGAKIMAEGTASKPIIFTSILDNIEVGQTEGTNLDASQNGLWGGLIVLGKAKGSFNNDLEAVQIEGIPADQPLGLYGGTDDDDNSGVLEYISIRHGGSLIGDDNEINGLTLGAVGRGTTINNIEVVANQDDGIEWFGGTVNVTNALVWGQGDDAFDIDQSYSGTITNAFGILNAGSDHGLEIDGPEGSYKAGFTINKLTLVGDATSDRNAYGDFRDGALGEVNNVLAYNFPAAANVELDTNADAQTFIDGDLSFSNWEVVGYDNSIFVEKTGEGESLIITDFTEQAATWTTELSSEADATVGADTSVFSWTYAAAKSAF